MTPEKVQRIADEKEEIFRSSWKGLVQAVPGLLAMLESLSNHGIPLSPASSAPRANIDFLLSATDSLKFFPDVLDEHAAKRGKPAPNIFISAAKKLDLTPARCVVFEDSHPGIKAARRAGCKIVGVATTHKRSEIDADTDLVIENFESCTLKQLANSIL